MLTVPPEYNEGLALLLKTETGSAILGSEVLSSAKALLIEDLEAHGMAINSTTIHLSNNVNTAHHQ